MKSGKFPKIAVLLAAVVCLAAGPCVPTAPVLVCPANTLSDGAGNCLSNTSVTSPLGIASPIGVAPPGFYYLGADTGFVLGNGSSFSTTNLGSQQTIPDVAGTFGGGPLIASGTVTEGFTAVAVYSAAQAAAAGVYAFDPVSGNYSDLTGYIVAVGYALTTSGSVVSLIARFSPRGLLDTSFNGTGYVLGSPGGFTGGAFTMPKAVAIDNYGKIVVAGYGNTQPIIARSGLGTLLGLAGIDNYLALLSNKAVDWYPYKLSQNSPPGVLNDEFLAFLTRYTATGLIDTTFDTTTVNAPPAGSAVHGYSVSPSSAFSGVGAVGFRLDFFSGLAIDSSNGIIAVGGSQWFGVAEVAIVEHYATTGVRDTAYANYFGGGGANFQFFSSVALDTAGNIIAAGGTGSGGLGSVGSPYTALVARLKMSGGALALDTTFNSAGTPGYIRPAGVFPDDLINSVAFDSANNLIALTGQTSSGGNKQTLIMTIQSVLPFTVSSQVGPMAGYGTGSGDALHGVAVITNGAARYFAPGRSADGGGRIRSLMTSFIPATLLLDAAGFSSSPWANAPGSFLMMGLLPPFANNAAPPAMYNPAAGYQLGPNAAVYGGGTMEQLMGIAPTADGKNAVVVGYTTDKVQSPLTGRSFPILLMYRSDGNFVNLGGYVDSSGNPSWDLLRKAL